MWARHMELMLGLWLVVSPFALRHDPAQTWLWIHDLACAALVVTAALLAHWHPLRRVHLALLPVAAWLVAFGWWRTYEAGIHPLPAYQNWILVGLMLGMFAIIPSEASDPPEAWRDEG